MALSRCRRRLDIATRFHDALGDRRKAILTLAYLVLALAGCAYVLLSVLLGHLGDLGHSGHDAGHVDGGHAADHASSDYAGGAGHGSASAAATGGASFHFPFFSPLALAALFAFTGAFGLIAKFAGRMSDVASLGVAIPAALATAYAVTYVGWRLIAGSRGSSAIRLADLCGARGEVITPIPPGGVGEVAAMVDGQRFSCPAREASGRDVPRGALVTVQEMVGTTLIVTWSGGAGQRA